MTIQQFKSSKDEELFHILNLKYLGLSCLFLGLPEWCHLYKSIILTSELPNRPFKID
jgi:hypothetical protein